MVDFFSPSAPTFAESVADASAMLLKLAEALVEMPDRVMISQVIEGDSGTLILGVDASDLERVTGVKGRTHRSLQTVVKAMAARSGGHLSLRIEGRHP